jgi:magnesium-transporting ATPase (P-type)
MSSTIRHVAYSGTLVTYGQAAGVLVATGQATELGRIGAMLEQVQEITTPLLRRMAVFVRWLSLAVLVAAATILLIGVTVGGYALAEMFIAVVALAVAAIPEGLRAILTVWRSRCSLWPGATPSCAACRRSRRWTR